DAVTSSTSRPRLPTSDGAGDEESHPRQLRQASSVMSVPVTVIFSSASGNVAGPWTTEPSSMEYWLPWQSQLIVPSETSETMQRGWLQTAVQPLTSPAVGWVPTTSWSAKAWPPPTLMSEVSASTSPPPDALPDPLPDPPPGVVPAEPVDGAVPDGSAALS